MKKRKKIKIGRNQPCPCGSGKKYKMCHWSQERETPASPNNSFPDMRPEAIELLNTVFHESLKADIPIFEFCLENNLYYFRIHSIHQDMELKKDFYENNTLTIDQLFKNWLSSTKREYYDRMLKNSIDVKSCLSKKISVVNEILDAHYLGLYAVSIATSFTVIEGLFRDYAKASFDKNEKAKYNIDSNQYRNTMLYSNMESIKYFSKYLNKLMSGKPISNVLHRNSVLHGVDDTYATEENSIQLILTIFEFANLESFNTSYWPPNSEYRNGKTYINGFEVAMRDNWD